MVVVVVTRSIVTERPSVLSNGFDTSSPALVTIVGPLNDLWRKDRHDKPEEFKGAALIPHSVLHVERAVLKCYSTRGKESRREEVEGREDSSPSSSSPLVFSVYDLLLFQHISPPSYHIAFLSSVCWCSLAPPPFKKWAAYFYMRYSRGEEEEKKNMWRNVDVYPTPLETVRRDPD